MNFNKVYVLKINKVLIKLASYKMYACSLINIYLILLSVKSLSSWLEEDCIILMQCFFNASYLTFVQRSIVIPIIIVRK